MNSNSYNSPVSLRVKTSLQKILLVVVPHLLIFLVAILVPHFSLALRLLIVVFLIFSLFYVSQWHLFLTLKQSVLSIKQDSVKNWLVLTRKSSSDKGEYAQVTLSPSSFVSNHLIIMNFESLDDGFFKRRKYTVFFTPDSLLDNEFRRLKVRLKIERK